MGRFVGSVPNQDPERLARVMDEKRRMIGVDKAALDKAVQERRAREAQESTELRAFAQQAAQLDGLLCQAHNANEQQRRVLNQGVDAFRQMQAEEKARRQAQERSAELAADLAEQQGALSSPWLNEDPWLERSAVSPHRVRKDHWKGMSEEQLGDIHQTQAQQVVEKAQHQMQERAQQQAYDSMQSSFVNALSQQAAQAEAARRQEAARLAAQLQRQAEEKRERDASLNRLYTNPPTSGYFAQFGTSHR